MAEWSESNDLPTGSGDGDNQDAALVEESIRKPSEVLGWRFEVRAIPFLQPNYLKFNRLTISNFGIMGKWNNGMMGLLNSVLCHYSNTPLLQYSGIFLWISSFTGPLTALSLL